MKKLATLLKQRADIVASVKSLQQKAESDDTGFSPEDRATIDAAIEKIAGIDAEIKQLEDDNNRLSAIAAATALAPAPAVRSAGTSQEFVANHFTEMRSAEDQVRANGTFGFNSFGEFAHHVQQAVINPMRVDRRLLGEIPGVNAATASTYGQEMNGADGGWAIPPDWSKEIRTVSLQEDSFLAMTDMNPITGNGMVFPTDNTAPWTTTGVQAYWRAEAAAMTQTKPVITPFGLRLDEMTCLVPMTQELLDDSATMSNYLMNRISRAIRWKTNDSLVNGTGAGMPLGILNAPALVSQSAESSQAATTLCGANVVKMFARMPAGSINRAVWIANNDVFPQLPMMKLSSSDTNGPPVWTNAFQGGLVDAPAGAILGRPLILSQTCQTLGTTGDIFFVDWSQYLTITKQGGVQMDQSIHLWFDQNLTAFRAIFRLNGAPWISSAYSPKNGSMSLSPFVALSSR